MKFKDKRLKIMNEILSGIKVSALIPLNMESKEAFLARKSLILQEEAETLAYSHLICDNHLRFSC